MTFLLILGSIMTLAGIATIVFAPAATVFARGDVAGPTSETTLPAIGWSRARHLPRRVPVV
jgi:hypothetical protein